MNHICIYTRPSYIIVFPEKKWGNLPYYIGKISKEAYETQKTNIFQQDGALLHRSKLVKQWIANQKFKILEEWPAISPDLNVVENCWIY